MKTVTALVALAIKICLLVVYVALALWAARWALTQARALRNEFSNKLVIQGTIV